MRRFFKMMVSLLLLLAAVMGAWGQAVPGEPNPNEFRWVYTKDVNTTFTGIVNDNNADVVMSKHLEDLLVGEFNSISSFDESVVSTADLKSNDRDANQLKTGEETYYFFNNSEVYSGDVDLLTIKSVNIKQPARASIEFVAGNTFGVHWCHAYTYFKLESSYWNSRNRQSNGYQYVSYFDKADRKLEVYSYKTQDNTDGNPINLEINETCNPENTLTPYTYRKPFLIPEYLRKSYNEGRWTNYSINRELKWGSKSEIIYVYKAKSPKPYSFYNSFSPNKDYHLGYNKRDVLDFRTEQRVKVLTAIVYKKEGTKYKFVKNYAKKIDGANDVTNLSIGSIYEDIKLVEGDTAVEGEYILVMGVIDLFNKMYFFKPVNMFIDDTRPIATGKLVNRGDVISQSEPVLVQWEQISDNFTVYGTNDIDIKDYLYVAYNGAQYKPISSVFKNVDGQTSLLFQLSTDVKSLMVTKEGKYENLSLALKDDANNFATLASNMYFNYSVTPPLVSFTDNGKQVSSEDSVRFVVDDITNRLRINMLRVYLPNDTVGTMVLQGLPLIVSTTTYSTGLESKTLAGSAERALLEKAFTKDSTSYKLNPNLNATDEMALRKLLTDIGFIEYGAIKYIEVPMAMLQTDSGVGRIVIEIEDSGTNTNPLNNREFTLNLNNLDEGVSLTIDGSPLATDRLNEYNMSNELVVKKVNSQVIDYDIKIESLTFPQDSVNNLTLSALLDDTKLFTIAADSRAQNREELLVTVTARYQDNRMDIIRRRLFLYKDTTAPSVMVTPLTNGNFRVQVTDANFPGLVAFKTVALDVNNSVQGSFTTNLPTGLGSNWIMNNWDRLAVGDIDRVVNLVPGTAAAIYAVDRWGNSNAAQVDGTTFQRGGITYDYTINNRTELEAIGQGTKHYRLSGNILITCDLTIGAGETLTFEGGATGGATIVYFQSSLNTLRKLTNNGGTIEINAAQGPVSFDGGGSIGHYNWFGIVNKSGAFNITSNNRISFSSAEAALTFNSIAGGTEIVNLDFTNCLIGIHWMNEGALNNVLTVGTSSFTNCVYGVKLDLVPNSVYVNTGDTGHTNYVLIDTATCSFNNMSRAKFYWNGLDF